MMHGQKNIKLNSEKIKTLNYEQFVQFCVKPGVTHSNHQLQIADYIHMLCCVNKVVVQYN